MFKMIKIITRLKYWQKTIITNLVLTFRHRTRNTYHSKLFIACEERQRMEDVSERLSNCLDVLGYNQNLIQFRRKQFLEMNDNLTKTWHGYIQLTAGSKAEGVAGYYESDVDRLLICENIICMEKGQPHSNSAVFQMDRVLCLPGYTRLRLHNSAGGKLPDEVNNCLVEENGEIYICNEFSESFLKFSEYGKNAHRVDFTGANIELLRKHGPCISFGTGTLNYDFVAGFECYSPDLLREWVQRDRTCDWPDSELIKRISTLEGQVVPVANAESHFPNTEWRICFTKAELLLVESLNEDQINVYILLKQLSKSVLEPICPTISSYIVKNVIFWLVESTPKERFAPELLLFRLMDAFRYLQECISCNTLNSYMIADRNLFFARITDDQRNCLVKEIDKLLNENEHIVRQLKYICFALDNFDTTAFLEQAEKREKIEKLILRQCVLYIKLYERTYTKEEFLKCLKTNEEYSRLEKELYKLVLPGITVESHSDVYVNLYRKRLYSIMQDQKTKTTVSY